MGKVEEEPVFTADVVIFDCTASLSEVGPGAEVSTPHYFGCPLFLISVQFVRNTKVPVNFRCGNQPYLSTHLDCNIT